MQIISHKNTTLTICQRFFIEKSIELLYAGSIDSYRIKLNNPKIVLEELKYCLIEYNKGRIKHFHTIKGSKKDTKVIVDEALTLLNSSPTYLKFDTISQEYLKISLEQLTEFNYKKVITSIEILLNNNKDYFINVVNGLEQLIKNNDSSFNGLCEIDNSLNFLLSELINKGYSKGFLYKLMYGIFVNSLDNNSAFKTHFKNFKARITPSKSKHNVIFRIDTTKKVYEAISAITIQSILLTDNIDNIILNGFAKKELKAFNTKASNRKFIHYEVDALDYLSALIIARKNLSEYLDVINLGLSDEFLQIHNRVLVIDQRSPKRGAFQNNMNSLDGKYLVEQDHYVTFTKKIPVILNNDKIADETKEKIKSAVRYLRLGNQSTEVEHKFINYWIGLEYLFSNYESNGTIERLKTHFIDAHSLAYVKRNVHSFKKSFSQLSTAHKSLVPTYTIADNEYLKDIQFYTDVSTHLINDFPLLAYRAMKLEYWFFKSGKSASAKKYLERHKENLQIHFTRIYRLRNEIIHDAATNTNNELIASNLRYYLTFILNEVIDFLSKTQVSNKIAIEDYFILNEIKIGNIEQKGSMLIELLEVDCAIDFIS
ncbi:hypothetical protein EC396_09225 [Lutibacter sp. HS1-25]|uniref:hypothetical protein n=1 Tax=Lutibacter sp. HS1-25 TaxID=2485000 RepID=UPI0010134DC1|nr:hypothetical protein [Lutibacter sp. HS1-25]RXP54552.1 hypothetical protein EC396_09225 [Lutibacter sp. HS1-25]